MSDDQDEDKPFIARIGPLDIDVPRTVGYYGGIAAAVAFGIVEPPLAIFIAAVPLLKLLKRRRATAPERVLAAVVEGASKPVGGDAESVIRPAWMDDQKQANEREQRHVREVVDRVDAGARPS